MIFSSVAANALFATVARVIGGLFALGAVALVARVLGPSGFGAYATVLAFLYIFQAIADLGLYSTLVREISKPGAKESQLVSDFFTMRLVSLGIALAIGATAIFLIPQYSSLVKKAAWVGALFYFFLASPQVLMGIFQKYLTLWKFAAIELASRIFQFGLIGILFLRGGNLFLVLGAMAVAAFFNFLLAIILAKQSISFGLAFSFERWKKILALTIPIGASLIFTLIYFRSDTLILSLLKPERDVGIYNLAYKLLESIIFFPAMLVGLIMPMLSRAASENLGKFRQIFQQTLNILLLFALPLLVGGIFLAEPIVLFIGGVDFAAAQLPLQILLGAVFLIFLGSLFGNGTVALNLQKPGMFVYFGGMVINVVLNLIFIPRFSYNAAAVTTLVTEFFIDLGLLGLIVKKIQARPSLAFLGKIIPATLLMAAFLLVFSERLIASLGLMALAPLLVVSAAIYFLSLWLLRGFKRENFEFLFNPQNPQNPI